MDARHQDPRQKAHQHPSRATAGPESKSNLHALLAALEQHEQSESLTVRVEESADVNDSYSQGIVAARTAPRHGPRNDDVTTDKDAEQTEYDDDEFYDDRSPRLKRYQDVQDLHAAHVSKRRRAAAAAPAQTPHDTTNALTGQRWLLQQREDGKRAVKPNDAFTSFTAPESPHAQQQKRLGRHSGGPEATAKTMHNPSLDAATLAALPVKFIDGPNLPRRKLLRPRTSWGWYMLGKGRLQHSPQQGVRPTGREHPKDVMQQHGSWAQPGAAPSLDAAGGSDAPHGALMRSDSSAVSLKPQAEATDAAGTGSVDGQDAFAAAARVPMAFATLSEAAAAAGATPFSSSSSGKSGDDNPQSAAAAPAVADAKKHRWVAGSSQWVTSDGVTVWPKVRDVLSFLAVMRGMKHMAHHVSSCNQGSLVWHSSSCGAEISQRFNHVCVIHISCVSSDSRCHNACTSLQSFRSTSAATMTHRVFALPISPCVHMHTHCQCGLIQQTRMPCHAL